MARKKKKSSKSSVVLFLIFLVFVFISNYPEATVGIIVLALIVYGAKAIKPKEMNVEKTTVSQPSTPLVDKTEHPNGATEHMKAKYQTILGLHELNRKEISQNFLSVLQRGDSQAMNNMVQLCEKDISLAPDIIDYYMQCDRMEGKYTRTSYPFDTFGRLSVLYERQKQYAKAIDICKQALRLGVRHDHIDESMKSRIDRLYQKMNHEKKTEEG